MSVLKNNGVNLGSGDPSSIADGDVKIDGGALFVRNGGAWQGAGGGGQMAAGQISAGDSNVTLTANFGFTASSYTVTRWKPVGQVKTSGTTATSVSFANGSYSDGTTTGFMWIACA